jgi:hypothetical protein
MNERMNMICTSAPSEIFTFIGLKEEVSSSPKMLAAVGDSWTADICEEVEGLSAWVGMGVRVEDTNVFYRF